MKLKCLTLVLFTVIMGGCASVGTNQAINIAVNQCPTLKKYTREQLLQAAKELKNIPPNSQITMLLTDYNKLRDACRIAEKKLKAIRARR